MQSDLISKRALIKFIDKTVVPELLLHDNVSGAGVMAGLSKVLEEMDVFPTIDAVPVVHGYWIANNICSVCWKGIIGWAIQNGYKFCPHCGAKMDAKDTNAPAKDGGAEE